MKRKEELKKNIIFSGGGTGGSVTPLLAVACELMKTEKNINYLFFGTKSGPEKEIIKSAGLIKDFKFIALPAGKWRRYFSLKNFFDIFIIIYAFFLSLIYLKKIKAKAIFSAGSFASVPLIWAAFFYKIPVLIHQQDLRPGLANLLMAKVAKVVGVTFKESAFVYGKKARVIGNPVRYDLIKEALEKKDEYYKKWKFKNDQSILLVIGGGTGALALNKLIKDAWPMIKERWQVIHIAGRAHNFKNEINDPNYRFFSFLPNKDLIVLMAIADLVLSRAGLGVLTELSALSKASIIVPMPNSHQEDNANILKKAKAAWIFAQDNFKAEDLVDKLNYYQKNQKEVKLIKKNISQLICFGAEKDLANILKDYLNKNS
jgi:UDP-N-acetylglucosamine--N-acetylmuramyl-(pentapeptide) pyrophosphoryl-undecaprenol N-acetylglucosamine transferase